MQVLQVLQARQPFVCSFSKDSISIFVFFLFQSCNYCFGTELRMQPTAMASRNLEPHKK
jgi:hypothetical protein